MLRLESDGFVTALKDDSEGEVYPVLAFLIAEPTVLATLASHSFLPWRSAPAPPNFIRG